MSYKPAFPEGRYWQTTDLYGHVTKHSEGPLRSGMTIRQWYKGMAMMAMQGLATRGGYGDWSDLVRDAASLADAMLAEDAQHEEQSDG